MARPSSVKARIVAIGNSQGVRIPKTLLEHAGLEGDVELHAESGHIVIAAARRARTGWAEAAAALHARGEFPPACRFGGKDGRVALDQLRTVDRERVRKRLGVLSPVALASVFAVLSEMFEFS